MTLVFEFLRGVRAGSEPVYWALILHLAVIPLAVIGLVVDQRIILGINPWIKPLKFLISTSIFLATAGWLLKDLGRPREASLIGIIVAAAMIIENFLISMQSLRGVQSHFNNKTILDGAIFTIMGVTIIINTVAMAWLFVLYCRSSGIGLSPGYLWGIRLGLLLFVIGSAEAGLMLRILRHTVGAADGGPGLPFVNWSTQHGDLRISHFFGLHALQALPLFGWLVDRLAIPNAPFAVILAAVAYGGIFTLLTLQALSGKPLWF